MFKRIRAEELIPGMYLHEFCAAWVDHPFWRTGFVLETAADVARIRAAAVREVWIDISRGLDLPATSAPAALTTEPPPPSESPSESPSKSPTVARRHPASLHSEVRRAAQICSQAKQAVVSMFKEARMGRAVDTAFANDLVAEITDSVARNPGALISLARLKTADDYTYMHSVAVCALMVALARQIGLNEAQTRIAGMAGLLHDLGKAAIPLQVLNKPGRLSDEEFELVKSHPRKGWEMLQQAETPVDAAVLDACLHHHERVDGTGYPNQLPPAHLSTLARMTAICDVYDAITSDRPYKNGWDPAESIRRMAQWTQGHLDERLFQAFVKSLGIYPVGSLVRLQSGRLGVVAEQHPSTLVSPRVRVFFSLKSDHRIPPEWVDLALPRCTDKIIARENPANWNFSDLHSLWSDLPGQPW